MDGQMPNTLPMFQVPLLRDIQDSSGFSPEQAAVKDSFFEQGC